MDTLFLEIVLVILTGLVMLVGLVGAVVPVLPGAWLIWLAALGYGLSQPAFGQPLFDGWIGGVAMVFLTALALVDLGLEYVVTSSVAAKEGVSFTGILASIGLGLVGLPFFPPIGPLVGAVGGLFLVEYLRHGRDWRKAWSAVMSYARGKGWSIAAELVLCLIMIGIWLAWVTLDFWIT
jgi:uncharacterized protein YqgC (DUF456 family)